MPMWCRHDTVCGAGSRSVDGNRTEGGAGVIQTIRNFGGAESLPAHAATSRPANPAETIQPPTADMEEADTESIRAAIGRINQTVQSLVTHLEFSLDTATHHSVVKVVDTRTHEVLRQFPSEEVLQIAKALDNFTGLLLQERA